VTEVENAVAVGPPPGISPDFNGVCDEIVRILLALVSLN
jgi:hypothetical protein